MTDVILNLIMMVYPSLGLVPEILTQVYANFAFVRNGGGVWMPFMSAFAAVWGGVGPFVELTRWAIDSFVG